MEMMLAPQRADAVRREVLKLSCPDPRLYVVSVGIRGKSHPLGASLVSGGANFSIYSRTSSAMELLFYGRADDWRPARTVLLDPLVNRTYQTGTHSCPACPPEISTGIGFTAHSIRSAVAGSIRTSSCSTRTAAR
jgi:hypothetical protein